MHASVHPWDPIVSRESQEQPLAPHIRSRCALHVHHPAGTTCQLRNNGNPKTSVVVFPNRPRLLFCFFAGVQSEQEAGTASPSDAPCTPPWSLPRVMRAQPRTPPGLNRPTATPPGHGPASQAADALEPYRKLASPAPVLEHSRSFLALLTYPTLWMGATRPAGRTPKITAARSMPRPPRTLA